MTLSKALLLGAALAAVACAAPVTLTGDSGSDPCAVLGTLSLNQTTYQHVRSCYRSIEFNPAQAKTTLDSLYTLYNDVFVFRDAALTPDLALPFSSPPVDIMAGLEKIRQKKYSRDFDFHSDLRSLAVSLNDAHVSYAAGCYSSIAFVQPISLYAPVIDGRQAIRVYEDATDENFKDCEVVTIDGEDATSYLQSWVDKRTGYSKDAGVRFNNALGTFSYSQPTQTWAAKTGEFSMRAILPESEHLTYGLRCDAVKGDLHYRAHWTVVHQLQFTDKASFLKNVCERPPPTPPPQAGLAAKGTKHYKRDLETELKEQLWKEAHRQKYEEKQRSLLSKRAVGEAAPSPQDLTDAVFVAGNVTAVYQLKSQPHVGILAVPTMIVEVATEASTIQRYMTLLAERNVTHLIIDTFGNGGGDVSFASLLIQVLFPSQDKSTAAQRSRFRATPMVATLADADIKNTTYAGFYDPELLADKATFTPFKTNPFLSAENITLNGREASYTQELYMDYNLTAVDQGIKHPWTNDASKLTLLTDGQCGSACGMFADLLVNRHGVKAVAVGGHTKKDLSMFSYAGAAVTSLDQFVDSFEALGLTPPLQRLPYTNTVNVGFIELFSGNETVPLEYDPARHVAAHRLDYTPETARNHDQLWAAVAGVAWA
ncbi:hypothetical protein BGZ70_005889 [Mortierella alpina]|uniref:Tail specific protease domain-containing protein n=1 Tax=Mortierella alpina TaxID=64518 RepID=A0A9P6M716_MORAP|nr:hypothetical protein BGZ70_005889 [Mortierella alpina]